MADLFERGVTLAELAKIFDVTGPNICHTLTRMGLDPAARADIRETL